MKCVSWNVNSIKARLGRVLQFLEREQPDLLCVQETKVTNEKFPHASFEQAGYRSYIHGQPGYNGVALLAKTELTQVENGFDGDPVSAQARVISGAIGSLQVVNVYVINGQAVGSEHYQLKLTWLDALLRWLDLRYSPEDRLLIVGDFNIAPTDLDVHDPDLWRGKVLCTDAERGLLNRAFDWGLCDLLREHTDEAVFSWWDYRAGAFRRNRGLRIDLALGTERIRNACRGVRIDREARRQTIHEEKPSDHAPVIVELEDC